ncbi:g10339 [Coccomyxa viridis]|uniref:G10339 protein n=1 Tax=Coccomyxa viridis TaxID=1274662 RepID=A0ABP1G5A1_9CHLO
MAFGALIQQMLSAQNEQRQAAEAVFAEVKSNADLTVTNLLGLLKQSPNTESRAFCAVMLRKVLTKDDPSLWPQCTKEVQVVVKAELLNCVREEKESSISKKVCDTIAELASGTYEELGWPELLPFIFQCVQSNDARLQESALLIFAQLAHHIMGTLRQYMATLHEVLTRTLQSPNHDVALASMRATAAFVQELEEPAERDRFQSTIPQQLTVIWNTLQAGDEGTAQEALELFIEVAEAHPRFLRKNLTEIVNAMLQISEATELEDSTRQLATEFLVTLCEAREKAPGMMRKLPQHLARLFQCLVFFLLDIEDEPNWHRADTDKYESEGEGELYEFGQESLDRLALALGGNTVAPLASSLLPTLLQDPDWKKRHAALICISQIAEGCVKVLVKTVRGLADMCMQGLQDQHPKVRWAACQAVGQMCTDLGPDFQEAEHTRLLPGLMAVMDDFNHPRIQAHAAAAVVNFSENCEQNLVPPYLDALIQKLLSLLQNGQKVVQEGALTAMASVADCAKDSFAKYYTEVMPLLRHVLGAANDKAHALLRAKCLECISLVGMAVGRDTFREDAHAVMQFMQSLQATPMEADDPTGGYMLQAGARICKSLGEEFLPYLSIVMPPLLKSAQLKPDVKVTDVDDDEDDDEDEDVEHIYLGDRKLSVRTSVLEEKATACTMLCCYADELKEGFYPYVEQVTGIMLPLLKFYFQEEVRQAAVQCIPDLLRSAYLAAQKGMQGADANYVRRMVDFIWGPLVEAIGKEPDTEVMSDMLEAVEEMVEMLEPALLPVDKLGALTDKLAGILADSSKRRAERLKRLEGEDFDEDEALAIEEENEDEENLLDQLSSLLSAIMKKYGDAAMPLVDLLMPSVAPLLAPNRSAEERRIALCLLDDILEFSPAGSAKYISDAVPQLLAGCKDKDHNVRQCSVYGLGILAQQHHEAFRATLRDALVAILGIITAPGAREEENETATENAIAALGRVLENHSAAIEESAAAQSWNVWVNSLPLAEDKIEARYVHAQLVRHVEASDPRVLGKNNENLGKIVAVMARCLGKGKAGKEGLVDEATWQKMLVLLQQMNSSLPPQVMQGLLGQLKARDKSHIEALLAGR